MTVSVILVTIGTKDYLKTCLISILSQTYPPQEIIVIDNSLNPDLTRKIGEQFPSVNLFPSEQNLFFAAGMNKGIELSKGELVLCLNDDLILDKNFIQEAIKGFALNKNIGMVSGKILRRDEKTIDSVGLFLSIYRTAKERGYGKLDLGQFEKSGFIFGVSGCAAFYRRKMLEKLKKDNDYFDSRLKMFYEDLDLAWRANKIGWQGYYICSAVAYHVRGGSFRPDSGINQPIARRYLNDELYYELIKNRYLTIFKNETFFGLILHMLPMLLYDFCTWTYILFKNPKVLIYFLKKLASGRNF